MIVAATFRGRRVPGGVRRRGVAALRGQRRRGGRRPGHVAGVAGVTGVAGVGARRARRARRAWHGRAATWRNAGKMVGNPWKSWILLGKWVSNFRNPDKKQGAQTWTAWKWAGDVGDQTHGVSICVNAIQCSCIQFGGCVSWCFIVGWKCFN